MAATTSNEVTNTMTSEYTNEETISQSELGRRLGFHHSKIRQFIEKGELSTVPVGKRQRILLSEASRFTNSLRAETLNEAAANVVSEATLIPAAEVFNNTPDRHAETASAVFSTPVAKKVSFPRRVLRKLTRA